MPRAFEGILVIDFTQVLSGPYLTAQLALEGADVIKVEPPNGDQMRNRMIPSPHMDHDMASAFLALNHGKRSVVLDMKTDEGRGAAREMVKKADVVVQNFRGGVAERLGLGWEDVKAINPRAIYCQITGYGTGGPKGKEPAYDGAIQAASGMMSTNGHPETGPTRTGYFPVDLFSGMTAAYAVAAALFRRERTGLGQMLDVSMLDAALNMQAPSMGQWLVDGFENTLIGNSSATLLPTAGSFACSEGSVLVAATMQAHVEAMFEGLGIGAQMSDPRLADTKSRIANKDHVLGVLTDAFRTNTARHWSAELGKRGVPIAEVRTIADAVTEPQLDHRGTLVEVPAPQGFDGPVRLVGPAYTAADDGPVVTRTPPGLGEHTAEVLSEFGLDHPAAK